MKKFTTANRLGVIFLCAAVMTACSNNASTTGAESSVATSTLSEATTGEQSSLTMADLVTYDDEDHVANWNAEDATMVQLNGTSANINGSGAAATDESVTIAEAGTYVLSGTLNDSQIVVDTEDEELVHLVLNGVDITDSDNAPIYSKGSGKTIITLVDGTKNTISDGKTYVTEEESSDEPSAAIFSKSDLTINGTGSLLVKANYKDGITSKDDLKIVGGMIEIQAADDGMVGRDLLAVEEATMKITAGGDGIKSTNDEDEDKGVIAIAGGTFNIEAVNDGIQAETNLLIDGGTYTLATGGGSTNAEVKTESGSMGQGPGMGRMNGNGSTMRGSLTEAPDSANITDTTNQVTEMPDTTTSTTNTTDETTGTDTDESSSAKGIKSGGDLVINGGTFKIDSADDAVHSNRNVMYTNGEMKIASGDDAVHADSLLTIAGGTIDITGSNEGLEGADITISGGETHVIASDDGVNASGSDETTEVTSEQAEPAAVDTTDVAAPNEDEEASMNRRPGGFGGGGSGGSQNAKLTITGGLLTVDAEGDGLDANGSITMSGGTVIANGPTSGGNGTLDYDGSFTTTGGTLIAAGSSGMAQGLSDDSSQLSVAMTYSETQQAGTLVHLEDSEGNDIATFKPTKEYQFVVISSPDLQKGGSYTLYSGGTSTGSVANGWYTDGVYEEGTQVVQFELSDTATTWLNEEGITTGGNSNRGPGAGGK